MEKLNNLVVFENNKGLEVKDFETVKNEIEKGLNDDYKLFVIQNSEDLKKQKEIRADLNKIAKEINDNKIAWVNDLTLKVKDQVKIICDLIKAKSGEFDDSIKTYENKLNEEMGIAPKLKTKYELTIKFTNKEDLDKFINKLPKKLDFTVKEK